MRCSLWFIDHISHLSLIAPASGAAIATWQHQQCCTACCGVRPCCTAQIDARVQHADVVGRSAQRRWHQVMNSSVKTKRRSSAASIAGNGGLRSCRLNLCGPIQRDADRGAPDCLRLGGAQLQDGHGAYHGENQCDAGHQACAALRSQDSPEQRDHWGSCGTRWNG